MNPVIEQALHLWRMDGAHTELIAARENVVYKLNTSSGAVALRLHRQGYRSNAEIRSELEWMAAMAQGGIRVPGPVPSKSGDTLHVIDGIQVDVLSWLSGAPMDSIVAELTPTERAGLFNKLGQEMAKLHQVSDAWSASADFTRCVWDKAGLVGDSPLWDCFWDNPALSNDDRQLLNELRYKANRDLDIACDKLDFGLIHADLVSTNVMVSDGELSLIDFDDGGFGFRLFDIVTVLLKFSDQADYPALKTELINGYQQVRFIDLTAFDMFMALRAATYVGWNIKRINEEGGKIRNARFIETARRLAVAYLLTG